MYYLCSKILCRMKRILITLLTIVMLCTSAKAISPFSFGVTAGMNVVKGEVDGRKQWKGWSSDSQKDWFAGLQLKFTAPIIGLGFDASLLYSRESVSLPPVSVTSTSGTELTNSDNTKKHDYLTVPVHLRYDLQIPGISLAAVPFIFAGPQASLSLSKIDEAYQKNVKMDDLIWRFDLGGGVILLKHLQAAYNYSFPLSKTYEGKFFDQKDQFESDYKQGVHRVSLTLFF